MSNSNSSLLFGEPPFMVALYSKKAGGKTTVIRFVAYTYKNFLKKIIVISETSDINQAYDYLPKEYVHSKYDSKIINDLMGKQIANKKANKLEHVLLILDDVIGMNGLNFQKTKDNPLNQLFTANRHYNISMLVASQGVRCLPKLLRLNIDYAVILKNLNSSINDLYEEYSSLPKQNSINS